MSLCTITVSGTLKEDPEKRFTPSNIPVTNLKVEVASVSRSSANRGSISYEVLRVNAWRDLAEYCEKLQKGNKVLVIGRALINSFTAKNGKKRRVLEIDANSVVLLKNILEIQPPLNSQFSETENTKANSGESDELSTVEQMITNTEEIPF